MRRRHKKKKGQEEVQLNLAAMLDMAFQLLAFFVMTFQPSPAEGQISLRMPPPMPIKVQSGAPEPGKDDTAEPLKGENMVTVSVVADLREGENKGKIYQLKLGEEKVLAAQKSQEAHLALLHRELSTAFDIKGKDQLTLQAGSGLTYDSLMQVVNICAQLKLKNGEKLTKMTFVELPDSSVKPPPKVK